jgi:hypothetical protein
MAMSACQPRLNTLTVARERAATGQEAGPGMAQDADIQQTATQRSKSTMVRAGDWRIAARGMLNACTMPLHLIKLSVGISSLDELRRWQASRALDAPPLRHRTRNFPRRADEIVGAGSIYWVINRLVTARQRVLDIAQGVRDDGTRCADLMLDPVLVPVHARFIKPFQGWRYLDADDAPGDDATDNATTTLPEALRRELASLALI